MNKKQKILLKRVEKDLESHHKEYTSFAFRRTQEVWNEIIKPFLAKRNWSFKSGMGTWVMHNNNKDETVHPESFDYLEDEELGEIEEVLGTCIPGEDAPYGWYMPDFNPKAQRLAS